MSTMQPLFDSEQNEYRISDHYEEEALVTYYLGDRLELLNEIPSSTARLIVTSPPYNIGKSYEKRVSLDDYLEEQEATIKECFRILSDNGSICWQVGNHVAKDGEVFPLDILIYPLMKNHGLKLRNRIVWTFGHGMHLKKRFSPRYETILWFTKTDDYIFNLDPVRIPQKYPGKRHYKGPKAGQYSGNPKGKNPEDVWDIPHVKSAHPEKTTHPCQFPIELMERLVLSMTNERDLVVDPYAGVGSTLCAATIWNRRSAGSEIVEEYVEIGKERIIKAWNGLLPRREMGTPIYTPRPGDKLTKRMDIKPLL